MVAPWRGSRRQTRDMWGIGHRQPLNGYGGKSRPAVASSRSGRSRVAQVGKEINNPRVSVAFEWCRETMDEIEAFLGECRADPWFQSHPEVVDRLEGVLTNFYLAGEGPEWQAIWEQVHAVLERTTDTPVDRCQALATLLQGVTVSWKTA